MDGEIVSLPNQPSPQQPMHSDGKKISILWINLIIITLTLFSLGSLNYLNILPLSNIYPNQLGFLPHKPYEQPQKKEVARVRQRFPTVSLVEPAKQTLMNFLPVILAPSLIPTSSANINLREDKGIKQSVSGTWDTKDGKAITILTVSPDGKEISQMLIFFPYVATVSASVELAQSTIPRLFSITPKGKWACRTIPNSADYCENFWEEDGTRRGIALRSNIPFSQAKKITISFCEHSQKSRLYSWKSCAEEFSKTGVQ